MSATETVSTESTKRRLIPAVGLHVILGVLGATGGFFAVRTGIISPNAPPVVSAAQDPAQHSGPDIANSAETTFVPIDPMVVSIGRGRQNKHLRFRAELEVNPGASNAFQHVMPRILDMLNGYLRALEPSDIEDPLALLRIRSQLLQRVNLVSGGPKAKSVLITEFVMN